MHGMEQFMAYRHSHLLATATILIVIAEANVLREFRAGIVMVEKSVLPFKMEMVGPALDMAIEYSEEHYGIRFEKFMKLYPDWCNSVFTTGAISDLYHEHNISVLIGPGCSGDISVCGKLATFYRLPQVTGVGDLVLGKEDYPTLTRMSYSLEKQSVFLTAMLNKFNWKHTAIIHDEYDVLMRVQGNALVRSLKEEATLPRPYHITFDTTKNPDFSSFLDEASKHARVIVLLSSGDDLRELMLEAFDKGMTNGEYAFVTIELFRSEAWGDFSWKRDDERDLDAKQAFESLLFITLTKPGGPRWPNFTAEVISRAQRDYNFTYQEQVNYFVGAFYDGVIYLAKALNRTIEDGEDPYDGLLVAQKLWNNTFEGIMGDVYIDSIGDRLADYSLLDMSDPASGIFEIVSYYYGGTNVMEDTVAAIHWPGGQVPEDKPRCGFAGEAPECQPKDVSLLYGSVLAAACVLFFIAGLVGTFVYRRMSLESELSSMTWKVKWVDVVMNRGHGVSMASTSRLSLGTNAISWTDNASGASGNSKNNHQIFTTVGTYNGSIVAVRRFPRMKIELKRDVLLEFKKMKDATHDNLTRFMGACVEPGEAAILTEYCPKGSLQDILANDAIKLDWLFRYSLTNDIIMGMIFLHNSPIHLHGRLKSSNCVVDSRFVLKVTDFGLPHFYYGEGNKDINHHHHQQKLWTAPEHLDQKNGMSQEGDVYSLGIMLYEIITRQEPFGEIDIGAKEIVDRVQRNENPPFRPRLDRSDCSLQLFSLTERCWKQDPSERPTFEETKKIMARIRKKSNNGGHILDNLISRLEQYAENLEALVEDRTQAFLDEKKRSEELLYRVLPKSVAEQLKEGKTVSPEAYECVTIYFSDIVGFTTLSALSTPFQVVDLLNDLYSCFDAVVDSYDVYKVETIGDAYMVVSGLPLKNGNEHACEISRMSMALLDHVSKFKIRHRQTDQLKLRIGIHSGSCVAGVVGLTMPRYCLFGDTVNTASRLESTGEAQRIHVSPTTKEILDVYGTFNLEFRGETHMKGKGSMKTYWLLGENSSNTRQDYPVLLPGATL